VKAHLVGRVPLSDLDTRKGSVPVLGDLATLGLLLVQHDIDRAVIAPRASNSDDYLLDVIRIVKALGVNVSVLPSMFEVVGSAVEFDDVNGMLLLGLRRHGLTTSSRLLKRGMDVAGATVLLVLLAPLLIAIALAVKLTSRGPVLFHQRRIGRRDEEFVIYKFRTMVDGAEALKDDLRQLNEADGIFKLRDDPRVTRVGRFLRMTSLDELPQLLNVLRGHMSLVGPRPLPTYEVDLDDAWQRNRLRVQPGLTGLWQVSGRHRLSFGDLVRYDLFYVENWSLCTDLYILLRTIPAVLGRSGV
jgi:exopolysaccharide biosynthesis polyprenyl glycosylphosphotransferase